MERRFKSGFLCVPLLTSSKLYIDIISKENTSKNTCIYFLQNTVIQTTISKALLVSHYLVSQHAYAQRTIYCAVGQFLCVILVGASFQLLSNRIRQKCEFKNTYIMSLGTKMYKKYFTPSAHAAYTR